MWPRELAQILLVRTARTVQRRDKFIDALHPTEKGNEIIAEQIYRYLTTTHDRDVVSAHHLSALQ